MTNTDTARDQLMRARQNLQRAATNLERAARSTDEPIRSAIEQWAGEVEFVIRRASNGLQHLRTANAARKAREPQAPVTE